MLAGNDTSRVAVMVNAFSALASSFTILFLFWTIVTVPYESLGPEITFEYHERTTLFGMRDGFLIAGTLAAAAEPEPCSYADWKPGGRSVFW